MFLLFVNIPIIYCVERQEEKDVGLSRTSESNIIFLIFLFGRNKSGLSFVLENILK